MKTVQALVDLIQLANSGQRVNSIFGEGASPKLRKIRDGLDALGFQSDKLLQHGRSRIVYGVNVVKNMRKYLFGMDDKPEYLFSVWDLKGTVAIEDWWQERWLTRRLESDEVLDQVARHTLVRPIRHGASINLPPKEPNR